MREFFRGENPIGRTVRNGNILFQVIGICGDVRFNRARAPVPPLVYRHYAQTANEPGALTFEVRTAMQGTGIITDVRQAIRAIDRDLPLASVRTQREQIDATIARERLFTALTVAFGALAAILASIGIYGTVAYAAGCRTEEIGVRKALGARPHHIAVLVGRDAFRMIAIGLTIGLGAALMLSRLALPQLWGVSPTDPLTYAGVSIILIATAAAACFVPVRQATHIDPAVALRRE